MIIYLGADHRGFVLKETLKDFLAEQKHEVRDLSPQQDPNDDYPQVAYKVVEKVLAEPASRAILLCGSGAGMTIAANRFPGIRAALGFLDEEIRAARNDDDINVLVFSADLTSMANAFGMTQAFLDTPFEKNERHERRIKQLDVPPKL